MTKMYTDNHKAVGNSTRHDERDLFVQLHHRLLALEVDLKERGRQGRSARELDSRLRKIRDLKVKIQHLDLTPAKSEDTFQSDLGLPDMSRFGPHEAQVCEAYLQHREAELRQIDAMFTKTARWVEDAATGRSGFIFAILRLANLRKFIGRYEASMVTVEDEGSWIKRHASEMLEGFGIQSQSSTQLQALTTLFGQIDRMITRIATLRGKVKRVDVDVKIKTNWLRDQQAALASYHPKYALPDPDVIWQLMRSRSSHPGNVEKTWRSLRRYWDEVVRETHEPRPGLAGRRALTTAPKKEL